MWNLAEILKQTFSKFYSPSELLTIDEVIILFKGRVIFQQYIPKKHKYSGIKIYKPCDEIVHAYDMTVYSFLEGGKEISYRSSWFILMIDILEMMAQVGRWEWHSTKVGLSRSVMVTQAKCGTLTASGGKRNVYSEVWEKYDMSVISWCS